MFILWNISYLFHYLETEVCLYIKVKFFIKDIFSKCDQIRRKLRIWSHLLEKYLAENFFVKLVDFLLILHAKIKLHFKQNVHIRYTNSQIHVRSQQ